MADSVSGPMDATPDPMGGVFRWARERTRRHLTLVAVGGLLLPVASALAGASLSLPETPTWRERATQGSVAALIGFGVVAVLALAYALIVAPYEQRKALRERLREAQPDGVRAFRWVRSIGAMLLDRCPVAPPGAATAELKEDVWRWELGVDRILELEGNPLLRHQFNSDRPVNLGDETYEPLCLQLQHRLKMLDGIIQHLSD